MRFKPKLYLHGHQLSAIYCYKMAQLHFIY